MLLSKYITKPLIIVLLGLLVSSCSKFSKLMKSGDSEAKFEAAMKYYEKKDYYKAGQLFDDLLQTYRGTLRAEQVYYYYTYCKYHLAEIPTAAFHFRNFFETYTNSQWAEECYYMYAYCTYIEAYPFNLDPSFTYKAIDEFQLFVNVYPQSKYVEKCNQLIDECRGRLQLKAYKAAKLYYNIEDYKAAMVSFKNLLKDFPDLGEKEKEESEYLIIKAAYKYAEQSIDKKKKERYGDVITSYKAYKEVYPTGEYLSDAKSYAERAQRRIEELDFLNIITEYELADQGDEAKKMEAFNKIKGDLADYISKFPDGFYAKQAKKYAVKVQQKLDKLTTSN